MSFRRKRCFVPEVEKTKASLASSLGDSVLSKAQHCSRTDVRLSTFINTEGSIISDSGFFFPLNDLCPIAISFVFQQKYGSCVTVKCTHPRPKLLSISLYPTHPTLPVLSVPLCPSPSLSSILIAPHHLVSWGGAGMGELRGCFG